ncbi:MAG TPA: ribonuclease T2 [Methylocella sp.]|nr:ribonuclease T2 [Methylocella sp.]
MSDRRSPVMVNRRKAVNRAGTLCLLIAIAALAGFALAWPCAARAAPAAAVRGPDQGSGRVPLPLLKVLSRSGPGTPGDFDFYVLSLSWSSGFCETPAGARARGQCDPGANLGFVVHGLWPQYEHGYPSDCGPAARFPSRIALESAQGLYPSEGLARHEWQKHGTCSGKSPTDYYADVRRARAAIVIPAPFAAPKDEQTWTPVDIARAFIAANPRLRPGMLGIACTSGVLQEVRICLSKDLRDYHACPEISREGCHGGNVSVPPVL